MMFGAVPRAAGRSWRMLLAMTAVMLQLACRGPSEATVPPSVTPLDKLSILGASVVHLLAGDSVHLAVELRDALTGESKPLPRPLVWSSSDTAVATVSATGQVMTRLSGYARVRVQVRVGADVMVDSVWVHASLPHPVAPFFSIQFDSTVSELHRRAAHAASVRWAEIITSSLPETPLNVAAGSCFQGTLPRQPVVGGETSVRVVVSMAPLEAAAGTAICQRRAGGLPAAAVVIVSTNTLYAGLSEATWAKVWFHELGHALGLAADLLIPPGQPLTSAAMLAGFQHDYGRAVTGITYTQQAHWANVPGDIMDGNTGTNAFVVGRATVGRLKDMGYSVLLTQSGPLDLERTAQRRFSMNP